MYSSTYPSPKVDKCETCGAAAGATCCGNFGGTTPKPTERPQQASYPNRLTWPHWLIATVTIVALLGLVLACAVAALLPNVLSTASSSNQNRSNHTLASPTDLQQLGAGSWSHSAIRAYDSQGDYFSSQLDCSAYLYPSAAAARDAYFTHFNGFTANTVTYGANYVTVSFGTTCKRAFDNAFGRLGGHYSNGSLY